MKFQNVKPPPTPKQSTFRITPYRLELKPNEEAIVTLEGYAEEPGPVKETLVCHAIIGKNLSKERIMQVPIRCQFITPLGNFRWIILVPLAPQQIVLTFIDGVLTST